MAKDESEKLVDDEIIEIPDSDEDSVANENDATEEFTEETNDTEVTEPVNPETTSETIIVDKSKHTKGKETKTIVEKTVEKIVEKPAETTAAESPAGEKSSKPKISSKKKLLLIIGVAFILAAAAAYYFLVFKPGNKPVDTGSNAAVATEKKSETTVPVEGEIADNTFFTEPKELTGITFIKDYKYFGQLCTSTEDSSCTNNMSSDKIKYYQVGTTKDGKRIILNYGEGPGDMGNTVVGMFAIETETGKFKVLGAMDQRISSYLPTSDGDSKVFIDQYEAMLADGVTLDKKAYLKELKFDKEITFDDQELSLLSEDQLFGSFLPDGISKLGNYYFTGEGVQTYKTEKIASSDNTDLYRVVTKEEANFTVNEIHAVKYGWYSIEYNIAGTFATSSSKMKISWAAGDSNLNTYFSAGQGCGTSGYVKATNVDETQLVPAGSLDGKKVYQLPVTDALVTELYDKDYAKGEYLQDEKLKNLTPQQFTDKHAYFLAQNGFGDYVVYLRDDMFVRGGCAKPVIYLYPDQVTSVDVAVGADVVLSDPQYPEGGWKNVLATPSGTLFYNGQIYDSLFWEGYGHGKYPNIVSGTVVKSADAVSAIRTQLAQQGLVDHEINDFVEYWEPKLPNSNYVRLTWLNTAQLNRLAPLSISPRPQTTIRVFLDFEGLDKPINIAPQHLTSRPRKGFTLIEWGGLLKGQLK